MALKEEEKEDYEDGVEEEERGESYCGWLLSYTI